jgi:hypothetical protein
MNRNVFVADHSLSRSFHYRCDARAEGLGQRVPSINHGGHVWKADNVSELRSGSILQSSRCRLDV